MRGPGRAARALRRTRAAAIVAAALPVLAACQRGPGNSRLAAMQQDPLLRCPVAGATPWETHDTAGTDHGVGFGGRAPTVVSRVYHLDPARTDTVLDAFLACARDAGWQARRAPYRSTDTAWVDGSKVFPGGWTAALQISAGRRAWQDRPAVLLRLTADAG